MRKNVNWSTPWAFQSCLGKRAASLDLTTMWPPFILIRIWFSLFSIGTISWYHMIWIVRKCALSALSDVTMGLLILMLPISLRHQCSQRSTEVLLVENWVFELGLLCNCDQLANWDESAWIRSYTLLLLGCIRSHVFSPTNTASQLFTCVS